VNISSTAHKTENFLSVNMKRNCGQLAKDIAWTACERTWVRIPIGPEAFALCALIHFEAASGGFSPALESGLIFSLHIYPFNDVHNNNVLTSGEHEMSSRLKFLQISSHLVRREFENIYDARRDETCLRKILLKYFKFYSKTNEKLSFSNLTFSLFSFMSFWISN
jgi:hypothetical protein